MIRVFIHLLLHIYAAESRVHCWDKMATHWTPLGFSCPVNCANVISAIERLKIMDEEKISNADKSYENEVISLDKYIDNFANPKEVQEDIGKDLLVTYKENTNSSYKSILDKSMVEIQRRMATNTTQGTKGKCFKFHKIGDKRGLMKCMSRRGYDVNHIIKIISETLSRYTSANITFGASKKLLTTMLGENDLRSGNFDLKAVVKYLSHAFHAYQDMKKIKLVIQLRSQHCLTMYVPGCFCRAGYVERFGRCIRPSYCSLRKSENLKYMDRIIII